MLRGCWKRRGDQDRPRPAQDRPRPPQDRPRPPKTDPRTAKSDPRAKMLIFIAFLDALKLPKKPIKKGYSHTHANIWDVKI